MDFLKEKANPEGIIAANLQLTAGDEVHIRGGPFAGLVGVIHDPPEAKGRVKVLMQLVNRSVKLEVPAHLIESRWSVEIGHIGLGMVF